MQRYLQLDPNASGMAVAGAHAFAGTPNTSEVQGFGLSGLYGDGANVYQYLAG
ncbi:MAG: hypothetical protein SFY96_01585 [Planctomycetota bacterium]|nr:hypothetical protein [Planctomycetota bacterium]